ncbi:MAG: bifunctional hydroxymethylpyrimidine kinase/phosphomethylpyrimidine kinase [Sphingomonas sp.]|jgi:hydroxymethylpyrimidine/phosphomethylpyrimidine kinase
MTPRVLIIAGSDSGGGAGIQADIKTVAMLGGHAMTAVTAITAQNTLGVQAVHPVPPNIVVAQVAAVAGDIGVDATKIGMLGSAQSARALVAELRRGPYPAAIVLDPVMVATSGARLADDETIAAMHDLAQLSALVTPNLPELAALCGRAALAPAEVEAAAEEYAARIGTAVLVKGGHAQGEGGGAAAEIVDRLVVPGGGITRWSAPRIDTRGVHGTGCTLSSAIATGLARGWALDVAITQARLFVRLALHGAPGFGGGHGPMGQQTVRLDTGPGGRLNQVTLGLADYAASCDFYRLLGLRQIVGTDDGHYARFEAAGGATLSIEQGAGACVFFEYDDLDGEVARLRAAGLVFDRLPVEQSWQWREARLRDPAGNVLCLYQAGESRRYPPWRLDAPC